MLEAAMMEAIHATVPFAKALASSMQPVLREDGTFDLQDSRTHNVLEHDTSLTRLDFRHGDNFSMQPKSKLLPLSHTPSQYPTTLPDTHPSYEHRLLTPKSSLPMQCSKP